MQPEQMSTAAVRSALQVVTGAGGQAELSRVGPPQSDSDELPIGRMRSKLKSLQHSSDLEPRDKRPQHQQPASGPGCLENSLMLAADGRLHSAQRHGRHGAGPSSPVGLSSVQRHGLGFRFALGCGLEGMGGLLMVDRA